MGKMLYSHVLGFIGMTLLLEVSFVDYVLVDGQKILEDEKKVNSPKSHVVRSIQSEDGDIIDCVDIYKQPAFSHPALQDHVIQMTPNFDQITSKSDTDDQSNEKIVTSQTWQKSGTCLEGTIPIRRIQNHALLKSKRYGRKQPSYHHPVSQQQLSDNANTNYLQRNRSKSILLTYGYRYSGAKGDIKVWTPFVESDDEYSTSRVSLQTGPWYDFESVESGWAVNPSVYGDKQTRLYTYWTADASNNTGCFDLTCPGFIQTNKEIALGAAIYPISKANGLPYQITIYIFKDPNTSNWWVQYGERINIGYWPPSLFGVLSIAAQSVEWGGEVYSHKLGHPHTATAMGNGRFPDYLFGNSGYVKRIRIHDNSPALKIPEWASAYTDQYRCYDAEYITDYLEDPEFYYGGPGKNYMCP